MNPAQKIAMKTLPLSLSMTALLLGGCPAAETLTSVDGLEGGTLTSSVTVPDFTATTIQAATVNATNVSATTTTTSSLASDTAAVTSLDATSIETGSLTVTGATALTSLTTSSVASDSVTSTSVSAEVVEAGAFRFTSNALDSGSLLGVVVGIAVGSNSGYSGLNEACNNAHQRSHMCGELEILHFLRSPNFAGRVEALGLEAIDGASYATVTKQVVGFDGSNPIIADDCESWLGIVSTGEIPGLHARHVLEVNGDVGRVNTNNICSETDLRILCCGT